MKKTFVFALVIIYATLVFGMSAPLPKGVTVLVVPARYSVLQVAFDAADRMGADLVSYQAPAGSSSVVLDYWADREWLRISMADYQAGAFGRGRVSRVILVGPDEILPQNLVTASESLCRDVHRLSSLDTPSLINGLGKAFSFSPSDWEWFAMRYNLQLSDRNAQQRNTSWYDRSYYDDEWSARWHWLQRKHNQAQASNENEGLDVQTRSPPYKPAEAVDSTVPEPVVAPEQVPAGSTPAIEEKPASSTPEQTAPVKELNVPLVEPEAPQVDASPVTPRKATPASAMFAQPAEDQEAIEAEAYPFK